MCKPHLRSLQRLQKPEVVVGEPLLHQLQLGVILAAVERVLLGLHHLAGEGEGR